MREGVEDIVDDVVSSGVVCYVLALVIYMADGREGGCETG